MKSTHSIVNHSNGAVLWSGPCWLNNFFAVNQSVTATAKGVMLFDSDTTPVKGDVPVRSWAIGVDLFLEKEFAGGRFMERGIVLVSSDLSSPYAYSTGLNGIGDTIHFDASISVSPPEPKRERLPEPVETPKTPSPKPLTGVAPVTPQAIRPPNTSRPSP